jgi:hypothetical protein
MTETLNSPAVATGSVYARIGGERAVRAPVAKAGSKVEVCALYLPSTGERASTKLAS